MTNELFKFSKSKTKHAGKHASKHAGKQAGKHLGAMPCRGSLRQLLLFLTVFLTGCFGSLRFLSRVQMILMAINQTVTIVKNTRRSNTMFRTLYGQEGSETLIIQLLLLASTPTQRPSVHHHGTALWDIEDKKGFRRYLYKLHTRKIMTIIFLNTIISNR